MTNIRQEDLMLEIPRGQYPGRSGVNKFGRADTITASSEWEVWDGNAAYSWPATAVITKLSQTTDQTAMRGATIEVQGLDASWNAVTQEKALDASDTTTAVTLDTPLIRIFRLKVLANVVSTSPIRAHDTAESQDYAIISTGANQTLMAVYTVPNGKTAYMTNYYASINPATSKDPTAMPVKLWARDNDSTYEAQLKHVLGLIIGGIGHNFLPYEKFTQKTDIYITATPVTNPADVSAGFDLILVDN